MMSDQPPKLAFNLERDVEVLSAMASNLTPYLYESETFGYLAGDLPKLTLGGLLLRLYRLSRLEDVLSAEQQSLVQDARINFDAARSEWAVHYEKKLLHEMSARIDAFARFLVECREDRRNCGVNYPIQAEKRTMIKHLLDAVQERVSAPHEPLGRLAAADAQLHQLLTPCGFLSDDLLEPVYPYNEFWWLYGYIA